METNTIKKPSCMQVLKWLDAFVDEFNGPELCQPKDEFFRHRYALWQRPIKHKVEGLNEAISYFFLACDQLELEPIFHAAYVDFLRQQIDLEIAMDPDPKARQDWEECWALFKSRLKEFPDHPLGVGMSVNRSQIWLRSALFLDPNLPAPLPEWPLALKTHLEQARANFNGGSENWTRQDHEEANWANDILPRLLKEKGWFDPEKEKALPGGPEAKHVAQVMERLSEEHGIHKYDPENTWDFDPIAWVWKTSAQVARATKATCIASLGNVLIDLPGWTQEENERAWKVAHDALDKKLALPPRQGK